MKKQTNKKPAFQSDFDTKYHVISSQVWPVTFFVATFLFLAFLLLFSKMKTDVLKFDFKFLSAV